MRKGRVVRTYEPAALALARVGVTYRLEGTSYGQRLVPNRDGRSVTMPIASTRDKSFILKTAQLFDEKIRRKLASLAKGAPK